MCISEDGEGMRSPGPPQTISKTQRIMTILAFWQVGNAGFERGDLDCISHEEAFEKLWKNQYDLCARFYDLESFACDDAYGLHNYIGNADDFEVDYNNEELDGGLWCKAMLVSSDYVSSIVVEI